MTTPAAALREHERGLRAIVEDGLAPVSRPALRARAADVTRVRPVRWAWERRLPSGYLSLLLGAEGIGKGTLAAWIVAQVTRGTLPGDLEGTPTRVLIVADEDDFDTVWTPRLYAAGADLAQVHTLDDTDRGDFFDVHTDAQALAELVRDEGYGLLFLDQLLDALGVDVDDWRSKAVRDRLRPLRRLAGDLELPVLGALHPNKGTRANFRDLVSGSHAFNAVSRSSLLLAVHPDDDDRRVLVRGKGNLSAPPASFEFAIHSRALELNGYTLDLPLLTDQEEGDLTAGDLLKPDRPAPVRDSLADELDAAGTGQVQTRAELARAVGRDSADRSVGRALEQLELDGIWQKVSRGKWQRSGIGIGTSKEVPMSTRPGGEVQK